MTPAPTTAAKRLAEAEGLDLDLIPGTGADGRVTVGDVKDAAARRDSEVPSEFGPDGERIWNEAKTYLEGLDLWRDVHVPLLERYVRSLMKASMASAKAEEEPLVLGSQGQMVANPAYRLARDAELDAHKYAEALLLTPEALKRHLRTADSGDDDDLGF